MMRHRQPDMHACTHAVSLRGPGLRVGTLGCPGRLPQALSWTIPRLEQNSTSTRPCLKQGSVSNKNCVSSKTVPQTKKASQTQPCLKQNPNGTLELRLKTPKHVCTLCLRLTTGWRARCESWARPLTQRRCAHGAPRQAPRRAACHASCHTSPVWI
eukprot:362510-Chlamydomonas_euryale.AAC.1